MKKYATSFGIVLSLLFLWLAVKDTNFAETRDALAKANYWFIPAILASLAGFYLLKAIRWRSLLLPGVSLSVTALIPSMLAGAACNNILPAHLGEVVRTFLLSREANISKAFVFMTLVIERIFDIVSTLILLSSVVIFSGSYSELGFATGFLVAASLAAILLAYLITLHTDAAIAAIPRLLGFLPERIQELLATALRKANVAFQAVKSPRTFFIILVNSVAQWSLMASCVYFSTLALSLDVPAYASIVVLVLIVAGLTLPTSPGFFGTIQFCFVLGLGIFDIDANNAFAASVFYHLVIWSSVTSTGLLLMHHHNFSLHVASSFRNR